MISQRKKNKSKNTTLRKETKTYNIIAYHASFLGTTGWSPQQQRGAPGLP